MSASTSAPPSSTMSLVTGSLITEAVRPTPLDPRPVVYTARGASLVTYLPPHTLFSFLIHIALNMSAHMAAGPGARTPLGTPHNPPALTRAV
eukprot:5273345-Pyramimonas_sp.AAC.2